MKQILFGLVLAAILTVGGSAVAGDGKAPASFPSSAWRYDRHGADIPYPRSERAQSIWASGQCWSECGSYCAWGLAGCLRQDSQGRCVKLTDKCDRYCQRECRTMGGPLLPIEFPWE